MLSEISSLLFNNWALTLSGSCLKHTLMNNFCMVSSFRSIQSIRFRLKLSIKPNIYINTHCSHAHTQTHIIELPVLNFLEAVLKFSSTLEI